MTPPLLVNIKKAQLQYLEKIIQYENLFDQEEVAIKEISFMLDEIECFWLERLEVVEFELEELVKNHSCFLLSGAIYLNIADYEHYYFKSLGDFHLLPDPFLRMGNFLVVPEERLDITATIDYYKKAYFDTIEVLTKHKDYFYFLPTRKIAIKDDSSHLEMLDIYCLNFVSSILHADFASNESFCENYKSYEEIEKHMDDSIRNHFILTDLDETGLSLREKIELFLETEASFSALVKGKSESQTFLIITYSKVTQVIDILLICLRLGVNPYIRFGITFHYFALIMHTFIEDKNLKEVIEKTIVFYILRKTIEVERFKNIDFNGYCQLIKNKALLEVVIAKIRTQEIDVFKGGIKQVESIITREFNDIV